MYTYVNIYMYSYHFYKISLILREVITFTPGVVATTDSGLDAVATYSCNEGYNLTGDEIRTCQGSGQWDGAAPNCICK